MENVIDEQSLRETLGRRIGDLRRSKGLTQQDLADRIGLSLVNLNRIERGHATPRAHVLFSIADALGVSTDTLRVVSEIPT